MYRFNTNDRGIYAMLISVDEMVKIDESVIEKYHKKLITNLNSKGWAIYKSDTSFQFEKELELCVTQGSEKEYLKQTICYQVLPYVKDDSDWSEVKKAMEKCISLRRYPFWVELVPHINEDDEEGVLPKGVYLIDAIVFNEDENFELVVDSDLMFMLNITQERKGNIMLRLFEVDRLLKQLTLCERKVK